MKNLLKIELVTEMGTFKFANHHNSEADAYQAMCNFESNNWEQLGETSYVLHLEGCEPMTFKGMNASCNLAACFDDELAEELDSFYQSQY